MRKRLFAALVLCATSVGDADLYSRKEEEGEVLVANACRWPENSRWAELERGAIGLRIGPARAYAATEFDGWRLAGAPGDADPDARSPATAAPARGAPRQADDPEALKAREVALSAPAGAFFEIGGEGFAIALTDTPVDRSGGWDDSPLIQGFGPWAFTPASSGAGTGGGLVGIGGGVDPDDDIGGGSGGGGSGGGGTGGGGTGGGGTGGGGTGGGGTGGGGTGGGGTGGGGTGGGGTGGGGIGIGGGVDSDPGGGGTGGGGTGGTGGGGTGGTGGGGTGGGGTGGTGGGGTGGTGGGGTGGVGGGGTGGGGTGGVGGGGTGGGGTGGGGTGGVGGGGTGGGGTGGVGGGGTGGGGTGGTGGGGTGGGGTGGGGGGGGGTGGGGGGAVIPEPSTWMLMILGFGLIAQRLRRETRRQARPTA